MGLQGSTQEGRCNNLKAFSAGQIPPVSPLKTTDTPGVARPPMFDIDIGYFIWEFGTKYLGAYCCAWHLVLGPNRDASTENDRYGFSCVTVRPCNSTFGMPPLIAIEHLQL